MVYVVTIGEVVDSLGDVAAEESVSEDEIEGATGTAIEEGMPKDEIAGVAGGGFVKGSLSKNVQRSPSIRM